MKNTNSNKKKLSPEQREELIRALKTRFEKNMNRHKGLEWTKVQAKLEANTSKLWSLNEMERTGGEPDVVGHEKKTGEYIFYDCSAESPKGRRSVCYFACTLAHSRPLWRFMFFSKRPFNLSSSSRCFAFMSFALAFLSFYHDQQHLVHRRFFPFHRVTTDFHYWPPA